MADVKRVDEGTEFPEKRKLDLPNSINTACEEDKGKADSNKKQKIEILSEVNGSGSVAAQENVAGPEEIPKINADTEEGDSVSVGGREKVAEPEEFPKINADEEAEDEEEDDEDEEEYNAEQDEDGDEEAGEEPENVDRKGKGIMKDYKGKGKMIADSDSDDDDSDNRDDDDSSGGSDSEFTDGLDGSDVDADLLAEVDLGNILPSRTRQSQGRSGVRIVSDSDKGNDA